jgi:hypothetical protein
MKLRLLLPAIVATATTLGASASAHSEPRDAQAQAAALLSRPHAPGPVKAHEGAPSSSAAVDAHASAAALLSGRPINVPDQIGIPYIRVGRSSSRQASAPVRIAPSVARLQLNAHTHAAALLKGSRTTVGSHVTTGETLRTTQVGEPLSEHPAVLVAQTWHVRGIDPNTFIVAHPARLQLVAASPTYSEPPSAERLSKTSN